MRALVIDLGGTHANCAIIDDRKILTSRSVNSSALHGLGPVLPLIADTFRALMAETGIVLRDLGGLAFSFCGIVNTAEGRVTSTNQKYDDAPGIDLQAWARREFGLRFRIENDARMALLGESFAGAAAGFRDVVMFTLGTGIGGAAMMDGRLLRGKHYQGGCLGGHFPVLFTGRKCTCGAIGCAEAEAAGWSLPLVCKESPGFDASILAGREIDFELLFRAAAEGDAVALAVRERCLRVWAVNTITSIHAYDPEVVVYGGGVMRSADVIIPYVQDYVNRHSWTPWGKVQVRKAELGNDAGLLGAIPLLGETAATGAA